MKKRSRLKKGLAVLLTAAMVAGLMPDVGIIQASAAGSGETVSDASIAEKIPEQTQQQTEGKLITAWQWIDEEEYLDEETGNLALPGANKNNPASFDDITELLPTQILATVENAEDTEAESGEKPITLKEWSCEDYPETGAYTGSYTFTATLPEGYALSEEAEALEVLVELGGAQMYENAQTTGDFTVTGGILGTDYDYADGVLTIKSDTAVRIANTDPSEATTDRIEVADGVSANITLAGVNIDVSSLSAVAFKIADNSTGNVTITLADDSVNTLTSGGGAGLQKNGSGDNIGKLTIQGGENGTGTLNATGGDTGAGIGGSWNTTGSNIEITGGIVTANGGTNNYGFGGAGIGGGDRGSGSNITISGGIVIATGSGSLGGGAGIGGGSCGSGSNITISGGTVTATGKYYGAGIGGGESGSGSNITISGGSVKANAFGGVTPTLADGTTKVFLCEIDTSSVSNSIVIEGVAYPTTHNGETKIYPYLTAGFHTVIIDDVEKLICIGTDGTSTEITSPVTCGAFLVYGGEKDTDYSYLDNVLTIRGENPLMIKNANAGSTTDRIKVADGVSANITLAGVNIDVSGTGDSSTSTAGSAAFKIADDSTGDVTITLADGSENTLKSGFKCAGLQKNGDYSETLGKLTIKGGENGTGKLTATGGGCGAGIGGGHGGTGSNITITGGTVTATGGEQGSGIGGGVAGNGSNIKISGGVVTATGGDGGAGIGGGVAGNGSNIEISGGSVKADAGTDANDIGGGWNGNGTVTPTNGTNEVYLLTIENPGSKEVYIDGVSYKPVNHKAVDENDGNLYAYLTGKGHAVQVGEKTCLYMFDSESSTFAATLEIKATNGGTLTYDTDYTYADGVLTVKTDKAVTIANTDPATATTDRIEVADGVSANITLDGVNIDVSGTGDSSTSTAGSAAFKIADNSTGDVTITLADGSENTLKSGYKCAGLQKNGSGDGIGKLTIQGGTNGTGSLTATGGDGGAGIGGGYQGSSSNIEISGGKLTATGVSGGAGIGGGLEYSSGSNITISGGTVTATGGGGGAGIGGGSVIGSGSDITISGGTVTATGGRRGAGIGGGYFGDGSNITISGGSVKAFAGTDANDIGGGGGEEAVTPTNGADSVYLLTIANPDSAEVLIDGVSYEPVNHKAVDENDTNLYAYLTGKTHEVKVGEKTLIYVFDSVSSTFAEAPLTVYATDSTQRLAIDTDYTYADGVLTVKTDKAVTIANTDPATATTDRIEVADGVSANITLAGVNIDVSSSNTAAFKIANNSTGNVTITLADGSENTLTSGYECAGLQKNGDGEGIGKLTIKGGTNGTGTLTVTGGDCGAGIGSGVHFSGSNITISGGTVTVTGGDYGAGIGGGWGGSGSDIEISGGTVTATGGNGGAGIGGGIGNCGSNIEITGGTVTANGGAANADSGYGGAGIGGGSIYAYYGYRWGNASDITISGGVVTATGSNGGAGIGGGALCSGEKITISGGTVTATGSDGGAGIGGGASGEFEDQEFYGKASDIAITGGSVKAVAGANAYVIGSGEGAVTPTLGDEAKTPVYLLEIANDSGAAITINGTAYLTNHNGEKKIYAYLPAKTVTEPNVVKVGTETTKYIYDNSKWLIVPKVTAPAANDLVYTGKAQALVKAGTTSGGIMVYSLTKDGDYTEAIPTGKDAGTYTVWYKVKDGETYANTLPASVEVTIAKAAPVITNADTVKNQSTVFGTGEFVAPTVEVTGTVTYKVGETTYTREQLKDYLAGKNVSDSPITVGYTFKPTDTTNYKEATGTISFTIDPVPMSDIAPNIAVTPYSGSYDGESHKVVGEDGITGLADTDNTIYYSTDGKSTWSTTVPTITNAGTLEFYVKVTKLNYEDWISEKLTAKVSKKPVTVTAENKTKTYGQENPAFTFTVPEGALAGSDKDEALAVELSCEATASSPVTTEGYAITGTSASANYEVTVIPGILIIMRADAAINVEKASYEKTFGDAAFHLGVTDTNTDADADVQYSVLDSKNAAGTAVEKDKVIIVDTEGNVTIKGAGSATIIVSLPESTNYNATETKITLTVNKAENAPDMPENTMKVPYTNKTVSEITTLPANWSWKEADKTKTLTVGEAVTATAVYTGADAGNYVIESVDISITRLACTHDGEKEVRDAKTATCTKKGYTGDTCCKDCGAKLEIGTETEMIAHSYVNGVCSVCDKIFEMTVNGITYKVVTETGENGKPVGKVVTVSGNEIPQVAVAVTGTGDDFTEKNPDGKVTVPSEITGSGSEQTFVVTKISDNAFRGASVTEIVVPATVAEVGTGALGGASTITFNGSTVPSGIAGAISGTGVTVNVPEGTGDSFKTALGENVNIVEAHTHKYATTWTYDDTCHWHAATCGHEEEIADKAEHTFGEWTVTKEATEDAEGVKERSCSCGYKETEEIAQLPHTHKYADTWTYDNTYHWHAATCGHEQEVADKAEHTFGSWVTVTEATEDAEGVKKRSCSCGYKETAKIDKLAHTTHVKDNGTRVEPTCEKKGSITYKCTKCGEVMEVVELDALGHSYTSKVTKAATITSTGIRTYTCTRCGHKYTEVIPKLPIVAPAKGKKLTDTTSKAVFTVTKAGKVTTSAGTGKVTVTAGEVAYTKSTNTSATTLTIPSTVKIDGITYKVTSIGAKAFANNKKLTKVTIGSYVKTIGSKAFYKCTKLKTVKIGKNVTTIGASAFYGCTKLDTVSMGAKVAAISDKAFYKCTALKAITIPATVKKIGKQAFYGCKKLKTVTIKTTKLSGSKVGSKAFTGIYAKATVKVPKSKYKAYKKLLKAKGLGAKAGVKK